jgi:ammonium transporter, Amt family
MGAILLGALAAAACYFFVTTVKNMFHYDDSLDVFGVHGVGGIVGAVMTGVFSSATLGGVKGDDYSIAAQVWIQIEAVAITIAWTGIVSFVLYRIVDRMVGLRVDQDSERQGLDQTAHGESAYHG